MVIKPAGIASQRIGKRRLGRRQLFLAGQRIALERVEQGFVAADGQRFIRLSERNIKTLFRQRFLALIIGLVGWLKPVENAHLLLILGLAHATFAAKLIGGSGVVFNPFPGWGMGCKQTVQPARFLPLGKSDKGFLQFHGRLRVVAGTFHVVHAVIIGVAFGTARVALLDKLRPE